MTCLPTMTPKDLPRRRAWTALLALAMLGTAAQPASAQRVNKKEGDLAAAGFIVAPATTPARQAMLRQLPRKKLLQRTNGDVVHYVYADPRGCNCLYVGDQQAYGAYKLQRQQQGIADEAAQTAFAYSNPAWNWGLWGGDGFGSGFRYGPGW